MLISELTLAKRRRMVGSVVICVVLMAGLAMWQMGHIAEAAVLDPHPGLVGWWRFDEGLGGVAEDSSGFGNHGTVYGATWVAGRVGNALSFDGVDDYVDVSHSTSLNLGPATGNEITVEAWVKADAVDGTRDGIVSKHSSWGLKLEVTKKFQAYLWEVSPELDSGFTPTAGVWYHVAFTYSKSAQLGKIYVNGLLKASVAWNVDIPTGTRNVRIGQDAEDADCMWPGIIDEIRTYNRALSAAEILEIFQKGPDFSSKLLAKVPKGTTQFIVTLSWQGVGSIGITIESPSKIYTEDMVPVYQKTVYSSSSGDMLNIKRLAVSVTALSSEENWYIMLEFDDVEDYRIAVEIQT